jgi:hypothetical protein
MRFASHVARSCAMWSWDTLQLSAIRLIVSANPLLAAYSPISRPRTRRVGARGWMRAKWPAAIHDTGTDRQKTRQPPVTTHHVGMTAPALMHAPRSHPLGSVP